MDANFSKPFPTAALHNAIRDALWEVHGNLQAPEAMIAGALFTAMSIASQGDIDVQLPNGQIRPGLVFFATIANSGESKTGTDNVVLAPVYEHDAKRKREFREALVAHHAALRYWDTVDASIQRRIIRALNSGEGVEHLRAELAAHVATEPRKPERHRIVHQSITERPFMEALQGDGKCIAILSDEGEIILKGGAMPKLALLNKAWDGPKTLTFERSDGDIEACNPRVTLSFMVQEKGFKDFMNKRGGVARGTGFLARFLICWPASTLGFRQASLQEPVWEHLHKFHQRVTDLLDATDARRRAGDTSRRVLSFSPEAKELWVKEQNNLEPRLREGGPLVSVRDFASKALEITGRVAAIFHHFTGQEGDVISMETLQRALDVVEFYFDEFIRLFGDHNDVSQEEKDVRALGMYLHSRYWLNRFASVPRNEVRKCGPIRHQGRFEAALQQLCWEGSIAVRHENAVSRKGRLWIDLNPGVFSRIGAS